MYYSVHDRQLLTFLIGDGLVDYPPLTCEELSVRMYLVPTLDQLVHTHS